MLFRRLDKPHPQLFRVDFLRKKGVAYTQAFTVTKSPFAIV